MTTTPHKPPLYSLRDLAQIIGASIVGNEQYFFSGVADLEKATPDEISFFANPRYLPKLRSTTAGAVIVAPNHPIEEGKNYLLHPDPSSAFQTILPLFSSKITPRTGFSGIHSTAIIHSTATLGSDVTIGPYAVIDQDVTIDTATSIGAFVYIGPGSSIGKNTLIHPHVVIREGTQIGDHSIIQPGAVIGSCGYGYTTDTCGVHHKLDQLGRVTIENHVEIGANTTIDRARFDTTIIREGAKIDNLVQIGHNVEVGPHNLIVAQVGIAGSSKLGKHVVLGGKVAVNGHIHICDHVRVTACSGISKSVTSPGDYGGSPIQPLAQYNKNMVYLRRVGDLFQRVSQLEKSGAFSV